MARRIGVLVAVGAVAAIVLFFGVIYFFEPIAAADAGMPPPVPAPVALLVYVVLSVLLLDWVSGLVARPITAALILAASQIILVSVDFVLRGERSITTGAASAVLILATWGAMAAVYASLAPPAQSVKDHAVRIG